MALGHPLIIIIDGSTDGTAESLKSLASGAAHVEVMLHPQNCGKGAAVLTAGRRAAAMGATHILTFDADGQHPAAAIPPFLKASSDAPSAFIAGSPIFDAKAPWERVFWRKLANFWTNLLSIRGGLADSMFGMRIYPLAPLLHILESSRMGHRYDLECVAAIRLGWAQVPVINIPTEVKYFTLEEGHVSHYRYIKDNVRLAAVYLVFIPLAFFRWLGRLVRT
jgi:glycosyltransferase involved in cell wall biosynthesis